MYMARPYKREVNVKEFIIEMCKLGFLVSSCGFLLGIPLAYFIVKYSEEYPHDNF